jgi:hypothetical protein
MKAGYGILFIASWFVAFAVLMFSACGCMRLTKKYGAGWCRKCGATNCAKGFEEPLV